MTKQRKPKSKYEVLPQFSDSDSDIDIFNAKEQLRMVNTNHTRLSVRARPCIAILILLASMASIFVVFLLHSVESETNNYFRLVARTDCGLVSGRIETINISDIPKTIYVYKGIPFARPPINDLRWKVPKPLAGEHCWDGFLNASKSVPKCSQGENVGLEDCLYLNVYTPVKSNNSKLPVFVWIHGGDFIDGNLDDVGYSPDVEFSAAMHLVSVSLNYRLNVFGFLSLKELWEADKSHGNYGILDQILALKWIQNNIRNFGGDPLSVTICGQGAGGTSVLALIASPLTYGLFHKAISMSGSVKIDANRENDDANRENRWIVNKAKCKPSKDIGSCLRNLSTSLIYQAIPEKWRSNDQWDFPIKDQLYNSKLVTSGKLLPNSFDHSLYKNKINISLLIGNTAQEIGYNPTHWFNSTDSKKDLVTFLKERMEGFSLPHNIESILDKLYKNKNENENLAQTIYETIATDIRFTCPINAYVAKICKNNYFNVYRYIVTHSLQNPIKFPNHFSHNAYHRLDAHALFGFQKERKLGYKLTEEDQNFIHSIRSTVKTFMLGGTAKWSQSKVGVFNRTGNVDIKNSFHDTECELWNDENKTFLDYAWTV